MQEVPFALTGSPGRGRGLLFPFPVLLRMNPHQPKCSRYHVLFGSVRSCPSCWCAMEKCVQSSPQHLFLYVWNKSNNTYLYTHTRMSGRAAHLLYRGEMPSCCTQGSTHGWRPLGKLPHWGKLPTGSSILASPASTQVPPPSHRAPEVPLAQGQPPCLSWHSSLTQAQLPTLGSGLRNHSPLGSFCSNQGPLNQSSNQQSPILQNCADKTKGLSPNSLPDTRQWNPPPWDITFELLRAKRNAQL